MAEPVHAALRALGQRVRIYAPVGELVPGMAYLVRRLLENTSNESFLRHRFAEGRELAELLRPPEVRSGTCPTPGRTRRRGPPTDPARPRAVRQRAAGRVAPDHGPGPAWWRRWAPHRPGWASRRRCSSTGGPSAPGSEIVSVDPGAYSTVVCRSGRAGSAEVEAAVGAASAAGRELARARASPDGRPCCSGRRRSCGPGRRSWPPSWSSRRASRSRRPTATWPRPSTSASTTAGRRCVSAPACRSSRPRVRPTPTAISPGGWAS